MYKLGSSSSISSSNSNINSNLNICPECNTAFRLCLKEYQSSTSSKSTDWQGCAYGNATTPILGPNQSSFRLSDSKYGNMTLPFTFRWTVSCYIFIKNNNYKNNNNWPEIQVILCNKPWIGKIQLKL